MLFFLQKLLMFTCCIICVSSDVVELSNNSTPPVIEETEAAEIPITTTPLIDILSTSTQKLPEEITAKTASIETSSSESVLATTEAVTEESNETTKKREMSPVPITSTTETQPVTEKVEKEKAPENTFLVSDHRDKICLLAKFHAVFIITYTSKGGEQAVTVDLPKHVIVKGKCGDDVKSPVLILSWDEFGFTMAFSKVSKQPDKWMVNKMSLRYDTSVPLFDGATNNGKKTAQSKDMELFITDVGQSFSCPTAKVVNLYRANKKVATVSMSDLHLQPFDVDNGKFSEVNRCSEASIANTEVPIQDETVPLAVGLTLTILTLIVVLGFSIRRAYIMRKVDYNSME